jgi:hypothetical protein
MNGPARRALALGLAALLALLALGASPPVRAAGSGIAVTGNLSGPTTVGEALSANYTLTAAGGPAEAPNGTTIGVYSYNASLVAVNSTGATISPSIGTLLNGSAVLAFKAPSLVETVTIQVVVTSTLHTTNVTNTVSLAVSVVQPFVVNATLVAAKGVSVGPFALTVTLDGSAVGTVPVPTILAGTSYQVVFKYVDTGLSPGYHTFAISLAAEKGQVVFAGGSESFSETFYVTGPPPDYTVYYVLGIVAFVGAVFIWTSRVASRRRGRAKK